MNGIKIYHNYYALLFTDCSIRHIDYLLQLAYVNVEILQ